MSIDFALLGPHGFDVHFHEMWVGAPGTPERHSVPIPNKIKGVRLPFTPAEWCQIAMRDGDSYIGGCCGTSGAMQDIICATFRESGWIEAEDMQRLADLAEGHGGYEWWFKPLAQESFDKAASKWPAIPVWTKMGFVWHAVREKLSFDDKPEADYMIGRQDLSDQQVFAAVQGAMHIFRYEDLFNKDKGSPDQEAANKALVVARLLPAVRRLLTILKGRHKPFKGFAVVSAEHPDEIAQNGYGLAIYGSASRCDEMIRRWTKEDRDLELKARPIQIDETGGVQFG